VNTVPTGSPLDEAAIQRVFQHQGGTQRPPDARRMGTPQGGNILEWFPDAYLAHWRCTTYTVNPVTGVLQDFTFWSQPMPFCGYAVASHLEIGLPDVTPLVSAYIRVGVMIPQSSQDAAPAPDGALIEFDPFFAQLTGVKGQVVRSLRPHALPYGRRVNEHQRLQVSLQVITTGAGAAFNVQFDVQTHILNLDEFRISGR